jgi:hypothetical protein
MSNAFRKNLAAHLTQHPETGLTDKEKEVFTALLTSATYDEAGKAVGLSGSRVTDIGWACIHRLNTAIRMGAKPTETPGHTPIDWMELRRESKPLLSYIRGQHPCPRTWEEVMFCLEGWRLACDRGRPTKVWWMAFDKATVMVGEGVEYLPRVARPDKLR